MIKMMNYLKNIVKFVKFAIKKKKKSFHNCLEWQPNLTFLNDSMYAIIVIKNVIIIFILMVSIIIIVIQIMNDQKDITN